MSVANPFNAAKLLWHGSDVRNMFSGAPTLAPISLEWDLSNTCPHDCPFCSFGTSESHGYRQQTWQVFPTERALSLVPELAASGVKSITFTGGGEPLMHPCVTDIMSLVAEYRMEFGLVTNGYLLPRVTGLIAHSEHARFVRVSLDAATAETHRQMHRPKSPQFHEIVANMRALIDTARGAKRALPLVVGASFCVTTANWHQILDAARLVKDIGGSYLEVRPTYPTTWRNDGWDDKLTPSQLEAAVAALESAKTDLNDGSFQVVGMLDRFRSLADPSKGYTRCQIGPLMGVLGADGRLWHCCVQRGQDMFDMGSVLDVTFADAWRRAQERRMAELIDVGKCPRCRYDNYNRLIEGLQADKLHVNFV